MRTFIGIDFSREFKDGLALIQSQLRTMASEGRWKYIDNFHLTLKFLDEIDLRQAAKIKEKLDEICSHTSGFKLQVSDLGFFPGKGCLRVLWLSFCGEMDKLDKLQAEIEAGLLETGFETEKRPYKPHITIGQDVIFSRDFEEIKEEINVKSLPDIWVDRLYLFKSEQIGKKRVYTPMQEYHLKG